MGIGMALHEDLLYDRAQRQPLDGRLLRRPRRRRIATRRTIEVIFIETDDGLRAVRRQEHGRVEHDPVAGRGRQRRLQRDRRAA